MSRIFAVFVLKRKVFKHFDEDSRPREDKIIHNKVAKAAKTNHCRSLVETVCLRGLCVLAVRFPVFGCGSASV
jgi:hypothetical protein